MSQQLQYYTVRFLVNSDSRQTTTNFPSVNEKKMMGEIEGFVFIRVLDAR